MSKVIDILDAQAAAHLQKEAESKVRVELQEKEIAKELATEILNAIKKGRVETTKHGEYTIHTTVRAKKRFSTEENVSYRNVEIHIKSILESELPNIRNLRVGASYGRHLDTCDIDLVGTFCGCNAMFCCIPLLCLPFGCMYEAYDYKKPLWQATVYFDRPIKPS